MEHEIEKLKQTYLDTEAPVELDFYGFEDVLDRINNKKKNSFYIYRYIGLTLVVLVMLSGVAGITFASKPNSTLYPLKIAAQNAIANVTHTSPKYVEDTIDNILTPKKVIPTVAPVIIQSAPTPSPTSSVKKKIEVENEEEWRRTETRSNQQSEQKAENEHKEEVRGVSTTKEADVKQEQNRNNSDENKPEESNNSSSNSQNNSSKHGKD